MAVLLETKDLKRYYGKSGSDKKSRQGLVKAVDGVSLSIEEGKSLALIGESGSGKTTFGKLVTGMEKATAGIIRFQNQEIQDLSSFKMREIRKEMQMIFQSSSSVFDPKYTIGESIAEVLKNYEKIPRTKYQEEVNRVLEMVGLDASFADRNASSLSGGQCQRANIARALILHPKLVVCDEPVSSLDYSIRKQILQLLKEMQQKYGLTYLFITHDLSNVPYVCQQVAIMYQGQIVELIKQTEQLEEIACHPYTQLLFRSVPAKHPGQRRLLSEQEDQALTENFEKGCNFQNRCKKCTEQCRQHKPVLKEISYGHHVACHCFE